MPFLAKKKIVGGTFTIAFEADDNPGDAWKLVECFREQARVLRDTADGLERRAAELEAVIGKRPE